MRQDKGEKEDKEESVKQMRGRESKKDEQEREKGRRKEITPQGEKKERVRGVGVGGGIEGVRTTLRGLMAS